MCIYFDKKWVGLHFEPFFLKLIWSPWLPVQEIKDLEAAHKESMRLFQEKVKMEQVSNL
jgi:hypothetical protein